MLVQYLIGLLVEMYRVGIACYGLHFEHVEKDKIKAIFIDKINILYLYLAHYEIDNNGSNF
ncbi:MAG: hypothetical protein ACJAQ7_002081 [Sediminicola sp.]|jgi:hypothetical protein